MPPIDPFHLTPRPLEPSHPRCCPHCGYDCRGLEWGRPCPECGGDLTAREAMAGSRASAGVGGVVCVKCGAPTPGQPIGSMCSTCANRVASGFGPASMGSASEDPLPRQCRQCGYDLRGHPLDAPCPECGPLQGELASQPRRVSSLRTADRSFRVSERFVGSLTFQASLALMAAAILATMAIGLVSMIGLDGVRYHAALAIVAGVVAVVAWPLTPGGLDRERPAWLVIRFIARAGPVVWAVGLWWYTSPIPPGETALLLEFLGISGTTLLLASMASIARELELLHTSRRLTTSAVLAVPIGVFTWVVPFPENRLLIPEGAFGLVATIFTVLAVLPWLWLLLQILRSTLDLLSESRWTRRARADARARNARYLADHQRAGSG